MLSKNGKMYYVDLGMVQTGNFTIVLIISSLGTFKVNIWISYDPHIIWANLAI